MVIVARFVDRETMLKGHHILDYQFGGASNTDNIVALCNKQHKAVHKGLLDIIKI